MSKETCIVCLDKYEGSKEEHLENCRRIPIIATTDVPRDSLSRLYLMDMDHIEFSYCDCILYDRNGNPNCSLHQGRLQEFYDKDEVVERKYRTARQKGIYHRIGKDDKPYCKPRTSKEQEWIKTKEYITCKMCLTMERKDREREVEAYQTLDKLNDDKKGFYYTFGELELGNKEVGKVKDLE